MKQVLAILVFLMIGQAAYADGLLKVICSATEPASGKSIVGKVYAKKTQYKISVALGGETICESHANMTPFTNPIHGASYSVKVYKVESGDCSIEVSSIPVEGEEGFTYGHAVYFLGGSSHLVTVSCQSR
jgi:hypothetical protein